MLWVEEDDKVRIAAAWKQWHDLTAVLCDQRMLVALKGKIYRTVIRLVLICGAEAWTLTRSEELLERSEMRILYWILGVMLKDRKRNDDIHRNVAVACVMDKVRKTRLRWYGDVQWREDDDCAKQVLEADVYGQQR